MMKKLFSVLLLFSSIQIYAQEPIHSKVGPEINGIKQYLKIDSKDSSKPILLFLHGGPGFSSVPYFNTIRKGLQKDFLVVQWDQRETGITKAWNPAPKPISTDQMHQDTEEIIDYLLKRFDQEKLYLIGFSWGGYLGLTFARNHPEKLHAYVSVSSMISNFDSERITLENIRLQAEEKNLEEAILELSEVDIPFENWEELYYQRKWTAYFSGISNIKKAYPKDLFANWAPVWMDVFLDASAENFALTTPKLACPVYFFLSKKDLVSNYQIAERYFNLLDAPFKEIIWFEESTHEIPNDEPKKFISQLMQTKNKVEKMALL